MALDVRVLEEVGTLVGAAVVVAGHACGGVVASAAARARGGTLRHVPFAQQRARLWKFELFIKNFIDRLIIILKIDNYNNMFEQSIH